MIDNNKTHIKWNNVKSKVQSIDYGGNSIVKKRLDRIKKKKSELQRSIENQLSRNKSPISFK